MSYGIPYMGSKSKIVEKIIGIFPKADNFYDLFGGGFSVTHGMIKHRSKDFKQFHFNELRSGVVTLIKDAIDGKYNYDVFKPKWISREEFFEKKEDDAYIKMIWSFGNNGKNYLFGKDIEHEKRSLHNAIVFNEFDEFAKDIFGVSSFKDGFGINEKRLYLKNRLSLLSRNTDKYRLEQLQQLQQLEQLERIQQLQQLERLQQLENCNKPIFYSSDYKKVPIGKNSIIYCDIPYIGTADYESEFNHKEFYDWADSIGHPVFVSEYRLDDDRFRCVLNLDKRSMLSSYKEKTLIKTEKIFVNKMAYKLLIGRKKILWLKVEEN